MTEEPTLETTDSAMPFPKIPSNYWQNGLTAEQHDYLMNNLRSSRVAQLVRAGKSFSHLEAWDIKAHLIRVFGFGHFDIETLEAKHLFTREYMSSGDNPRQMYEIAYQATVQLTVRDLNGNHLCRFSESSVDSQTGSTAIGDLHDNAIKSAISGALKRCATSLGTQFGLSLYDNGNTNDIVRVTLVRPEGATRGIPPTAQEAAGGDLSPAAAQALSHSLGAEVISEEPAQAQEGTVLEQARAVHAIGPEADEDGPAFDNVIKNAGDAKAAVESMTRQAAARKRP